MFESISRSWGLAKISYRVLRQDKEMMVLSYLAEGKQNKEIANDLKLAEPTIKMHVTSICKKLTASNRTQAVIVARDLGLI